MLAMLLLLLLYLDERDDRIRTFYTFFVLLLPLLFLYNSSTFMAAYSNLKTGSLLLSESTFPLTYTYAHIHIHAEMGASRPSDRATW